MKKSAGLKEENSKSLKYMTFLPSGKKVSVDGEKSVLELACSHEVELAHSCGGSGSCGTCLVKITGVPLPERNEVEREMAEDRGFPPAERLACQTTAQEGMVVEVPEVTTDFE